ncbi:MAG: hypothetical protein EA409_08975 [Saprospirales bacterium]|nr:MAG: hypothetical protein EA409_08975 [Saprospirales bacterium]
MSGGILLQTYQRGISQLNYDSVEVCYSSYLGSNQQDIFRLLEVDDDDGYIIAGTSRGSDYPTTPGVIGETAFSFSSWDDGVISRFDKDHQLVFSTYWGSATNDQIYDLAILPNGDLIVVGTVTGALFPVTADAAMPNNPSPGSTLAGGISILDSMGANKYTTFWGGEENDRILSVEALEDRFVVAGLTNSKTLPTTPGAFQESALGGLSLFVTSFDYSGNLLFSTYLGGNSNDGIWGFGEFELEMESDDQGNLYIVAPTSSPDFPTTPDAFQNSLKGDPNLALVKMDSTGNVLYSSYWGGDNGTVNPKIKVTNDGSAIYLIGATSSSDFFTTPNAFQQTNPGSTSFFLSKFDQNFQPVYSTYLGGSAQEVFPYLPNFPVNFIHYKKSC